MNRHERSKMLMRDAGAFIHQRVFSQILMSCYDAPEPPDLTEQTKMSSEIAREQLGLSREQLAWAREQDRMNRDTLNRVLDIQLPAMRDQFDNAREDRQRYEEVYRPLEDNLITEFQNYDSPGRRMEERGRAIADVSSTFDAARRNALQRLESYGIDPSQTRNMALDIGVRTQQAAAQAGAANAADQRVDNTARALRADALNIGRGLPSQVAQSYGQSVAAGQAGVGGANATTGTSAGALSSSLGFSGQALQGIGQSAGIASQGYQNQLAGYNANAAAQGNLMGGIGGLVGLGMGLADGGMPINPAGPVDEGPTDGSGIDDQVPARLSVGEYVIPADVVQIKGREFFDKLVQKYHTPAEKQEQMRCALPIGG
jgi:hypothetical protein